MNDAAFQGIFEQAAVGIAQAAADGRFLHVNRAFCDITGYTTGELLARTFNDITHPEDATADGALARRLADGEIPTFSVEKRYVRKDGAAIWVGLTASAVRDEQGRLQHLIGIIEDITPRKVAEAALRESNERLSLISRAANDVLWDWDVRTQTLWWSEGFTARFGCAPGEEIGRIDCWSSRLHPDDRERVLASVRAAIANPQQQQWTTEYRFRRADDTYAIVRVSGLLVRDERGDAIRMAGALQDITERKDAEQRLLDAKRELQHHAVQLEAMVADRTARLQELVAELGTFSYSISHDLRAPLRSIQGFAQLLHDDCAGELSETARSYLQRIVRSAARMDALTKDVLEYSRISRAELTLETIDPGAVVQEVLDGDAALRSPHADVQVVGPLPLVRASETALLQCLSNLLHNAVKFVAPGVAPRVRIRSEASPERVRLWVEDNGIGIEPRHHEKIWGMLERLNATYEGTGLGLSIVRKAVERMGGRVGVESQLGQGSRFWIELERAD